MPLAESDLMKYYKIIIPDMQLLLKKFLKESLIGLSVLKYYHIEHRDIKPPNLLIFKKGN